MSDKPDVGRVNQPTAESVAQPLHTPQKPAQALVRESEDTPTRKQLLS
jgi:hypothetical protein